jgi:hypothetical protein
MYHINDSVLIGQTYLQSILNGLYNLSLLQNKSTTFGSQTHEVYKHFRLDASEISHKTLQIVTTNYNTMRNKKLATLLNVLEKIRIHISSIH